MFTVYRHTYMSHLYTSNTIIHRDGVDYVVVKENLSRKEADQLAGHLQGKNFQTIVEAA